MWVVEVKVEEMAVLMMLLLLLLSTNCIRQRVNPFLLAFHKVTQRKHVGCFSLHTHRTVSSNFEVYVEYIERNQFPFINT